MTLLDLIRGTVVEIRALRGGAALTERLHAFGLFVGSKIRLVKTAPLLIEDRMFTIASTSC